jgi:hypothetical protein
VKWYLNKSYKNMSWSVNQSGKPLDVASALTATASAMPEGQSKQEFTAALPQIIGLVFAHTDLNVSVDAAGHGSLDADGKFIYNTVRVTVTHN